MTLFDTSRTPSPTACVPLRTAHAHHAAAPALFRLLAALVGVLAALAPASPARANSDHGVVVLGTGGTTSAQILDLVEHDGSFVVVEAGQRPLMPPQSAPTTFSDLKILPDGAAMLADGSGRGVVIVDRDGSLRLELREPGRMNGIESAAVASYLGPGQPERLLLTEATTSSATIFDLTLDRYAWYRSYHVATTRGAMVQAVALDDDRVAVAVNFPALDFALLDVVHLTPGEAAADVRFAGAEHPGLTPPPTRVVEGLHDIRDLMATRAGHLLVTTSERVFELSPAGDVVWEFGTAQLAPAGGELASGRWLPSGLVAVASQGPGEWTRPHNNHRVHWIDPQGPHLVATSEVLTTAPRRLDAARGHGATGTLGYPSGGDDLPHGDAARLELTAPLELDAPGYRVGATLAGSAELHNPDHEGVALERLAVLATRGPCGQIESLPVTLWERRSVRIAPGERIAIAARTPLEAERFDPGRWCVQVMARDRFLVSHYVGLGVDITLVAPDRPPAGVRDLGGYDDVGQDVDDGPPPAGSDDEDGGCGCASTPANARPEPVLLAMLALLGARVTGRRRRPGYQSVRST